MNYSLGLTVPFHPYIHGYTNDSYPYICNYFIVEELFPIDEFYESYDTIKRDLKFIRVNYKNYLTVINSSPLQDKKHPIIKNYSKIMKNIFYPTGRNRDIPKIDIIKYETLPTQETVAYIKTMWLRIFQRKWRSIYKKRQEILKKRQHPQEIRYREIHGKWRQHLRY